MTRPIGPSGMRYEPIVQIGRGGMAEVLRNPMLPFILTLNFCNYACTFTVQGLWGGPFLREVHGADPDEVDQDAAIDAPPSDRATAGTA